MSVNSAVVSKKSARRRTVSPVMARMPFKGIRLSEQKKIELKVPVPFSDSSICLPPLEKREGWGSQTLGRSPEIARKVGQPPTEPVLGSTCNDDLIGQRSHARRRRGRNQKSLDCFESSAVRSLPLWVPSNLGTSLSSLAAAADIWSRLSSLLRKLQCVSPCSGMH